MADLEVGYADDGLNSADMEFERDSEYFDHIRKVNDVFYDQIKISDQKAAYIFTFILAFLVSSSEVRGVFSLDRYLNGTFVGIVASLLLGGAALFSAICAISVVMPRKSAKTSSLFWGAWARHREEFLDAARRKDPNYLKDSHIRLFAPNGSEVDPMTVDWTTDDAAKYRFRQDPGSNNAMASVKINFPSPDGVYMHDTPQQSLFGKLMRFDSSGCVRVQNVRDLVTWILRDTPGWDRQHFEAAIKTGENTPIQVVNPVPVHFLYLSAWSTGPGVVQFRDDIYGLDGASELKISSAL